MSQLDQLVKGAPPPGAQFAIPSTSPVTTTESSPTAPSVSDPLANLPSSPPQIYLNLLILEASLRAQWLQLRIRRRQHAFFLTLLGSWTLYFGYALFLAPREDGSGVGGSVYWVVEVAEKVCLMVGIVTVMLVWGTGQWERGVRWPRRWVGTTNRGLRLFNCKLVVIKHPWWREILSTTSFMFSYGLFSSTSEGSYRFVDHSLLLASQKTSKTGDHHALPDIDEDNARTSYEDDLAPGGDFVKLLLLPKPFSPGFRENWDVYRTEYWEKENERRGIVRKKLQERERKLAKEEGGWLWWTGYSTWRRGKTLDLEKINHQTHKDVKKTTRSGSFRNANHSHSSSHSVTPVTDADDGAAVAGHPRTKSSASNVATDKRKKRPPAGKAAGQKSSVGAGDSGSRSTTPEVASPMNRGDSYSSVESLMPGTPTTNNERDSPRKRASVRGGAKRKASERKGKS